MQAKTTTDDLIAHGYKQTAVLLDELKTKVVSLLEEKQEKWKINKSYITGQLALIDDSERVNVLGSEWQTVNTLSPDELSSRTCITKGYYNHKHPSIQLRLKRRLIDQREGATDQERVTRDNE